MLFQCWPISYDTGLSLKQRWANALCLCKMYKRRTLSEHFFYLPSKCKAVLFQYWSSIYDADPTLKQHWASVLYLLGIGCSGLG